MGHAGIPTVEDGFRMRSRLEARWAAFFTALGWRWEYEPFDCAGWIPDFLLRPADNAMEPTLVEVKPITHYDEGVAAKCLAALPPKHHFLLVGVSPFLSMESIDQTCSLGWSNVETFTGYDEKYPGYRSIEYRTMWCDHEAVLVRAGGEFDYWPVNSCCPNGRLIGKYVSAHEFEVPFVVARRLWAVASNSTQWRAPR